ARRSGGRGGRGGVQGEAAGGGGAVGWGGLDGGRRLWPRRWRGLGRYRARLSWRACVILGVPRLAAAQDWVARAGAYSRLVRRSSGGLRPRPGPLAYTSCNSRVGNTTPAGP